MNAPEHGRWRHWRPTSLTRLGTSELRENDTQQQAALLAIRQLVDSLQLECNSVARSPEEGVSP